MKSQKSLFTRFLIQSPQRSAITGKYKYKGWRGKEGTWEEMKDKGFMLGQYQMMINNGMLSIYDRGALKSIEEIEAFEKREIVGKVEVYR